MVRYIIFWATWEGRQELEKENGGPGRSRDSPQAIQPVTGPAMIWTHSILLCPLKHKREDRRGKNWVYLQGEDSEKGLALLEKWNGKLPLKDKSCTASFSGDRLYSFREQFARSARDLKVFLLFNPVIFLLLGMQPKTSGQESIMYKDAYHSISRNSSRSELFQISDNKKSILKIEAILTLDVRWRKKRMWNYLYRVTTAF